jgi:hypothetical protein
MASTSELAALAFALGESVNGHPENVTDALPQLAAILTAETDADVVTEAVYALGRAWDPRAAQVLLDLVPIDHPDIDVRFAMANSLPCGIDDQSLCRAAVIGALITLSGDECSDVRDWACFGLGQVEAESRAARDALAARLEDADVDTRCEALLALAMTGDPRAGTRLMERLADNPEDTMWLLEVVAAAELADPALHPALLRLSQAWEGDDDEFTSPLASALSRCHPDAKPQALKVERELVARVSAVLADRELIATTVGAYPRTALTVHAAESPTPTEVFSMIWRGEDPWHYPLEQMVGSCDISFPNETEAG